MKFKEQRYKSFIEKFENKYNMSFKEFEEDVMNNKEDFEKWDDYIEWKAYINLLKDVK